MVPFSLVAFAEVLGGKGLFVAGDTYSDGLARCKSLYNKSAAIIRQQKALSAFKAGGHHLVVDAVDSNNNWCLPWMPLVVTYFYRQDVDIQSLFRTVAYKFKFYQTKEVRRGDVESARGILWARGADIFSHPLGAIL